MIKKVTSIITDNALTSFIGKVVKWEAIDCLCSVGGFSAGLIEIYVDGNLNGKIGE